MTRRPKSAGKLIEACPVCLTIVRFIPDRVSKFALIPRGTGASAGREAAGMSTRQWYSDSFCSSTFTHFWPFSLSLLNARTSIIRKLGPRDEIYIPRLKLTCENRRSVLASFSDNFVTSSMRRFSLLNSGSIPIRSHDRLLWAYPLYDGQCALFPGLWQ